MGNLCGNQKGLSKGQTPPRDLASLLVEIRVPEDIEKSPWAQRFRTYLKETDMEPVLDFVIVCNVLRNKESEIKQFQSMKWKIFEINKERRELLQMIGSMFFCADCERPIPLSNSELRDELVKSLNCIDESSDERDLSEAFDLVWQARCDHKVWKGGLDPAYNKFQIYESRRPRSPLTAVLLTIL